MKKIGADLSYSLYRQVMPVPQPSLMPSLFPAIKHRKCTLYQPDFVLVIRFL